jgi:hypothetical protein
MKIHHNLGACVAGMVHSSAKVVRKRKKRWRESVVHEVLFANHLLRLFLMHQAAFSYAFSVVAMVQILHRETVGQVNSCHVLSYLVTIDQWHPAPPILQHFLLLWPFLDLMECLGILI